MKKKLLIPLVVIGTLIVFGIGLSINNSNIYCKFSCESYQGEIIMVQKSIKGYLTVTLKNNKIHHLGPYLERECSQLTQVGDSIVKIKGEMKVTIYRNQNYLCSDYNSYYKQNNCYCE